jgi:hypothetical protein
MEINAVLNLGDNLFENNRKKELKNNLTLNEETYSS